MSRPYSLTPAARSDLIEIDRIIYRAEARPLEIVRVLHASRDIQKLLSAAS
jgi:plasmid stabilization system protein ParE